MKHSIIILLSFACYNAFGQKTVTKSKESNWSYEEYSILASNKKIKHGAYHKFSKYAFGGTFFSLIGNYEQNKKDGFWKIYYDNNNQVKSNGYYSQGKKDSIWGDYYLEEGIKELREVETANGIQIEIINPNTKISCIGQYDMGEKIGLWEYFDINGGLLQQYNHDLDSLVYNGQSFDPDNHDAIFIGGKYYLEKTLNETYQFNETFSKINSRMSMNGGSLEFEYIIDTLGLIQSIELINDDLRNKKMKEQAIKSIYALDGNWIPKRSRNKPIPSSQTVIFQLLVPLVVNGFFNEADGSSFSTRKTFEFKISVD